MKKRLISIFIVILLFSQICSCFNYTEINKITFATSIIFDIDEYDNVKIFLDCVTPYRDANESSDKGKRVVYEGSGKTALEAMREVNAICSNDINFSQVRAYIFTQDAATKGLDKFVKLIDNNQELSFKTYMFVYSGDTESLLNVAKNDEQYLGLYLDQLVELNKNNGKIISSNVNDYLCATSAKPKIGIMSSIKIKDDIIDKKIILSGASIFKDNILIDNLEEKDVLNYNLLVNKINEGTFQVVNPNEKDKYITLDILENYNHLEAEIKNDEVIINGEVRVTTSIGQIEGKLNVTDNVINNIKKEEKEKITESLNKFFNEYKEKNIDILRIEKLIKQKYPSYNTENVLSKSRLLVNVDIEIDGSSLTKDSN